MAIFLKIVSGVYLAFVWLVLFLTLSVPTPLNASVASAGASVIVFMIAIGLSIPAVALFAFGQVVGDVRILRNNARLQSEHLKAMRAYYEPSNSR
ncbi:hypothetical protein [Bradyrhizobium valentinum]|uniref:Uncharacterized protein n=1 Tax=Bradyrhizobium valentinum TaxID=1518501 RepID=A0A0R3LJ25_9BRAD|nr:hypothetical protein [Bradyrhizobium valentinum]KRR07682.1 hypothetical protein CP49_40080 [Bradyrhizobium valentinum]